MNKMEYCLKANMTESKIMCDACTVDKRYCSNIKRKAYSYSIRHIKDHKKKQ